VRRVAHNAILDDSRGEPASWAAEGLREVWHGFVEGGGDAVSGRMRLLTQDEERGCDAALAGVIERDGGRITRFDLVARGDLFGQGPYTQGAPPGRFTLAVAFTLSLGGKDDVVPPQGVKNWWYLREW
jgi:hypothetical protein